MVTNLFSYLMSVAYRALRQCLLHPAITMLRLQAQLPLHATNLLRPQARHDAKCVWSWHGGLVHVGQTLWQVFVCRKTSSVLRLGPELSRKWYTAHW